MLGVMVSASPFVSDSLEPDRRFAVYDVPWDTYVRVRDAFDEAHTGVRLTYLEGVLELMSPSRDHEALAKLLARLVEAFAEERGLPLNGYKSTTFRTEAKARGLEPDECYSLGPLRDVPDLALEIVVSSSLVDKLAVYEGLRIAEVWVHREGALTVYRLGAAGYQAQAQSDVLPGLDVGQLATYVRVDADQTAAVRSYRALLRSRAAGG